MVHNYSIFVSLLENIRVRRSGYAFRQSYDQALLRYKMLSSKTWPTWKRSPRDGIKTILQVRNIFHFISMIMLYQLTLY